MTFASTAEVTAALASTGYISSAEISMAVFLAASLEKPILAEGPAGTGKTELAKAIAEATGRPLHRAQCYEGLDEAKLLYEWKYAKQLLYTQMLREQIGDVVAGAANLTEAVDRIAEHEDAFFSRRFLEPRPLLSAIASEEPSVLLIDEVDRAEEEIEALLLEVLAENQVTVPELGTIVAASAPIVVLTSNDTRELSDALRRRCLHLYLDYPSAEREAAILRSRVQGLAPGLADSIAAVVARLRTLDLKKTPSLSEAIDWARALVLLSREQLGVTAVTESLGLLLKHSADVVAAQADAGAELAAIASSA